MNVIKRVISVICIIIFPFMLFIMLFRLGSYTLGFNDGSPLNLNPYVPVSAIVNWFNNSDFNGLQLFTNLINSITKLVNSARDDILNSYLNFSSTAITDLPSFFQAIGNWFVMVFTGIKYIFIAVHTPFIMLYHLLVFVVEVFRFIFSFIIFIASFQSPVYSY